MIINSISIYSIKRALYEMGAKQLNQGYHLYIRGGTSNAGHFQSDIINRRLVA